MPGPGFIIKGKFFPPKQITTTFEGKTIIVTGSNSGVGLATALKYVQLAASTVILGVRSLQKGETAKAQIEEATGRAGVVQVWPLDMESFESIDAFAKRVESLKKVDAVVLNAGVFTRNFTLSGKGWENNLQINTLGTVLLAILLTSKLQASRIADSPAHLVVVTSTGYQEVQLKPQRKAQLLHKYNSDLGVGPYRQHVASKFFMMWITRELAHRCLDAHGEPTVIINDGCPGACRSDITRDFNTPLLTIATSIASFGPSALRKMGLACSSGEYITSDEGKILQKAMWTEVVDVLAEKIPRVKDVIASLSERRALE
ncbi:putative short-chain dehydrogenases/reductase [Rhexocercosporidium sp. MPI-PUGE-AT-0058]|nr:putative short-chain dehydrogenases/reductase [Rhexocercosporidium sp. MPI-PUGE-AT-0058]